MFRRLINYDRCSFICFNWRLPIIIYSMQIDWWLILGSYQILQKIKVAYMFHRRLLDDVMSYQLRYVGNSYESRHLRTVSGSESMVKWSFVIFFTNWKSIILFRE